MPAFIDLTGKRFGRLTVIRRHGTTAYKHPTWLCHCSCGNEHVVTGCSLSQGASRSCGCLDRDQKRAMCIERNTTHGLSKTKIYKTWVGIRTRCYNPRSTGYHKYGAKGIRVCKRWRHSFENFLEDMGLPPSHKHTIDRRDNHKDYSPSNCRWATQKEQQNNRTNNVRITYAGKTLGLPEWASRIGLDRNTIRNRLKAGATVAIALSPKRFDRRNGIPRK